MKGSRSLWVTPLPCSTASHRPGDVFTSTTPQVQGSARSDNHLMGIYTFFKKEKNFTNKTKQENPITPTNNNKNPGKVLGSWGVVPRASAQQTSPSFELLTLLQPQRSAHGAKCPHGLSRPQLSFAGSRAGPSPLPPGARTAPQQPAVLPLRSGHRPYPPEPSRLVPSRPRASAQPRAGAGCLIKQGCSAPPCCAPCSLRTALSRPPQSRCATPGPGLLSLSSRPAGEATPGAGALRPGGRRGTALGVQVGGSRAVGSRALRGAARPGEAA